MRTLKVALSSSRLRLLYVAEIMLYDPDQRRATYEC